LEEVGHVDVVQLARQRGYGLVDQQFRGLADVPLALRDVHVVLAPAYPDRIKK
jgi:hypothetical protein